MDSIFKSAVCLVLLSAVTVHGAPRALQELEDSWGTLRVATSPRVVKRQIATNAAAAETEADARSFQGSQDVVNAVIQASPRLEKLQTNAGEAEVAARSAVFQGSQDVVNAVIQASPRLEKLQTNAAAEAEAAARASVFQGSQDVVNAVIQANNTINMYLDIADNAVNGFLKEIQVAIDKIQSDSTAKAAQETGIEACGDAKLGVFAKDTAQVLFDMARCATDYILEFETLIKKVIVYSEEAVLFFPSAIIAIDSCASNTVSGTPCLTEETKTVTQEVNAIVEGITSAVARGQTLATDIPAHLTTCANAKLNPYILQAGRTVSAFAVCAIEAAVKSLGFRQG